MSESDLMASGPARTNPTDRVPADELKSLFLFEALDPDQLGWLSDHGHRVQRASGHPNL